MRIQMYRNDVSISQLTCHSVDKFENYSYGIPANTLISREIRAGKAIM